MSADTMRAFEEHSQSAGAAYVVGRQLAWWAERETDLVWLTDRQIMDACRLSKRTVHRALRSLELSGEIVREPSSQGRRRVYRVDPKAAGRMALFGADRVTETISEPVAQAPERAPHVSDPDYWAKLYPPRPRLDPADPDYWAKLYPPAPRRPAPWAL